MKDILLEAEKAAAFNAHDMGEMGKFIRLEYMKPIMQRIMISTLQEFANELQREVLVPPGVPSANAIEYLHKRISAVLYNKVEDFQRLTPTA